VPKFDLILRPGQSIPEEFDAILSKRLSEDYRKKLLKHGGLVRVSVASPYVDRQKTAKRRVAIDEDFIATLESEGNNPNAVRERVRTLPVKLLSEICHRLRIPVRSAASSREIREAIVQRLNSEHVWRRIAGSDAEEASDHKQDSSVTGSVLHFAYGSNMDWAQMTTRCPSAAFSCRAKLPAHRLAFTRRSINRGCGVADILRDEAKDVWGIVYEIPKTEMTRLDESEGFRPGRPDEDNAYTREDRQVLQEGDAERPIRVFLYRGHPQPNPPLPSRDYKTLIINGAKNWKLPADYIHELECIETAL
jgi:gamma-glutamylcyclotransferase (GGCT)/AIG2-like uncharacterized protein YtfP